MSRLRVDTPVQTKTAIATVDALDMMEPVQVHIVVRRLWRVRLAVKVATVAAWIARCPIAFTNAKTGEWLGRYEPTEKRA